MSGDEDRVEKGGVQERHEEQGVPRSVTSAPDGRTFRFTVEERRRLADFIILLDRMDRARRARREEEGVA